ncbi:MAG: mannose-6-phosphate isomerase [Planctomycetota bacterium]|jgi:mannose-6-phosphate isomerase
MTASDPKKHSATTLNVPLRMDRISLEKVWGGRSLERVPGISIGGKGPVGETWELVDRTDHNSKIRGGPHADGALRDLMATDREALLGNAKATADERFPVLIKYLSAEKPLSIQVHPDDRTAKQLHAGENGKTESWYILDAEPGSLVYLGLQAEVDASQFSVVAAGPGVVDLVQPWPVKAGQFVHVPAGTLHAIGEGITLLEVQQNSDVTYRLYDWGRLGLDGKPRSTQVEECLLAVHYEEPVDGPRTPELESLGGDNRGTQLIDCEHYSMSVFEISSYLDLETDGVARAVVLLKGPARLWLPDVEEPWIMEQGDTWLIPALIGKFRIECQEMEGIAKIITVETKA